MSLEAGLYGYLSSTLSVGDRIHPGRLPQDVTLPALVYQLIPSTGPLYTHDGDANTDIVRVQLSCWGGTYDEALALLAELRAAVSGYSGAWDDVVVGHCLLEGWRDDVDEKTGAHRRLVDAVIQYQQEAAS